MKHLLLSLLLLWTLPSGAVDAMAFWQAAPRHGANSMNSQPPDAAYLAQAKQKGIAWLRLAHDKWPSAQRDFLIGNADQYRGLVAQDLATLKAVLDRAQAAGLKVVIAPLSLPGMRWRQNNGNQFDGRVWLDTRYWQQSADFWRDLALALKDHPALAAFNLVNEPAPENEQGLDEAADAAAGQAWYAQQQGSPRDLFAFYQKIIAAIREVDPSTPIMVDGGWYARTAGFSYWPKALDDANTLYAFHMYEPYVWSSPKNHKRAQPLVYPGTVDGTAWNRTAVAQWMAPFYQWAKQVGLPAHRLVAAEFGCHRMAPGCAAYLEDVLSELDAKQSHWAFYSFREDSYDGYDYELGSKKLPWQYWEAQEKNQPYPLKRQANPLFEPIAGRLARP